jgi:surface protein
MEHVSDKYLSSDVLAGILHFLALDGAAKTFRHLAYLTCNSHDLRLAAKRIEWPLVLRVGFDRNDEDKTFIFPFRQAKVVKIKIYWGDGSSENVKQVGDGFAEHRYHGTGEFIVRVFPLGKHAQCSLDHIGFSIVSMPQERWWKPLRSVDNLGSLGIRSLSRLFQDASCFNLPLNHLDVSNIVDMSYLFHSAAKFDQPLHAWDVGSVTKMCYMFYNCAEFDRPIGSWNVSRVTDMFSMFEGASSFSGALEFWNVSNVRYFYRMFFGPTRVDKTAILDTWKLYCPLNQPMFRGK